MTRKNILSILVILGLSAQIMAQTCQVTVAANKRDYSYPDGQGHTNYIYDLVLTNTGSCVVNSIVLNIVPAITSDTFSASWNLNQQTATRYEVVNFGGYLAPGSQFAGPGFILASSGTGAVTLTVNTQTCNTCSGSSSTTAAASTTTSSTTAAATTSSTTAATTTTSSTTAATTSTTTTTGTTGGSTTGSSSGCTANVFLTARQGSTWTEANGQISQIYDVTIQNTGSCNIDTIQLAVTIPSGASVTQRWNLDNNWFVNTYGAIPVNGAYLGAGFVLTGPGPNPSVASVAVQTINCANCGGSVTTTSATTASATTTTGSSTTGGSTTTTTTGTTTGSSSGCNAEVSIAPRVGSSWTESNGQVSQIYDITTKNIGTCTLNNVRLNLIISSGSFVSQKWNLDAQYNVNLPNGGFLAPGASYGEAGIVLTGGGSVAVSVAAKACNSC